MAVSRAVAAQFKRIQTKGEDLLNRFAQTDADNPPSLATFCSYFRRNFYSFTELDGRDNRSSGQELSDILEGEITPSNAWPIGVRRSLTRLAIAGAGAKGPSSFGAWSTTRSSARQTITMTVSVKGASRGSGATVTLDGTEPRSNGEKPVKTKLTNNAAGPHPPVTCPQPSLKGGRRGASGGSRDWVKARSMSGAFGMTLYHETYITSEAVPKPALAVPERD